jgi:hypothetical protein
MRGIKRFGFLLMLVSVTACAPVAYDATYRSPTGHVSVQTSYFQPVYRQVNTYRTIRPIEVTLYADNSYRGVYFSPIRLVIADNQYVEIPARDRRGRNTRIFAHYHRKNLHFDADRNCNGIHGASQYKYDKKWKKGHKYSSINAGRDYDLSGLHLQIRNTADSPRQQQVNTLKSTKAVKKKLDVNKKTVVRVNNEKSSSRQQVRNNTPRNNIKRAVVREKTQPLTSRAAKVADRGTKNRPVIVEKISKHEQSKRITIMNAKSVNKESVRGLAKKKVKSAELKINGKAHKSVSAEETVSDSKMKNHRLSVRVERSDKTLETEEYGNPEKVRGRNQRNR